MQSMELSYVCYVVAKRNELAKERMVYRNRRRAYQLSSTHPEHIAYREENERKMEDVRMRMKELTTQTTKSLRKALRSIGASLVDDRNAGYAAVWFYASESSIGKHKIKKIATEYEATVALDKLLRSA